MIESVPVLLDESVAVTVIVFDPSESPMSLIVHEVVPEAEPEVGSHVGQAQVTEDTDTLSDAVPPRLTVLVYPLS